MSGTFNGGVHPHDSKSISSGCAVTSLGLPTEVILPVRQHIGAPARIIVAKGDVVKKGQVVAEAGGFVSAPIHASVSGTVKSVEPRMSALGVMVESVVIESDGQDDWADGLNVQREYEDMKPEDVREAVKNAGIVGLGGAAFPTHVKLSPPSGKTIDAVILNGVECEPYATCDHRLMLERPGDIVKGLLVIMKLLGCKRGYIGIERNKPDAIKMMREAVKSVPTVKVVDLHVKYPQGGEKQLIYAVTKRKVPAGGLPMDVGCVVQNVGTAVSVYEAVAFNRPLIERIVTVTGNAVSKPANLLVRLGDSVARLVENAGGYADDAGKLILGGPMMGIAQYTDDVPVTKGTSCVLVMKESEIDRSPETACISCGRCVDVCPMNLLPTTIAQFAAHEKWDDVKAYNALDCIECGCCTYICPSKRKLLERIKFGKSTLAGIRAREQAAQKAASSQ